LSLFAGHVVCELGDDGCMYAPDLATTCQFASGPAVRAIGWLENGKPIPTGETDPQFLVALRAHATDPCRWLPFAFAGMHFCDLGDCERISGSQCVIVPAPSCLYIAPDLIVHYVEQHSYAPPAEFIAAVLACPEQCSDDYVALLLPFASTFRLDADGVRSIAADAPARRKVHAEAVAERLARDLANRGNFKW